MKAKNKSRSAKTIAIIAAMAGVAGLLLYAATGLSGRKTDTTVAVSPTPPPSTATSPQPTIPGSVPVQPLLSAASGVSPATVASGPRIRFATPEFDFGRVNGGDVVKHEFFFTNVGNQMLEISNVQPTCGCTAAGEWSRTVAPGKSGSIPIQFNSGSYSGPVEKSITVTCNDPTQPAVNLQIKCNIWRPVEVSPQFAVIMVTSESPSNATTVRILNNVNEPLTVSNPESNNRLFTAQLKTNQPGKEFELIISTVPPLEGANMQGQISLKTSSTNTPVISVTALANMQKVIETGPPQIILPAAPLTGNVISKVSIINNGTNVMVLTDPAVNAKGVDIQIKEFLPGRQFIATLTFPEGFEIGRDEKVEFSVKSNHPQFPLIKFPVLQPPRPAPVAVPAPGQPKAAGP
ncbi:MAG: DUF1573 domain-containing protein [Verrucomicrobia bacterium]|nr:DUF1573 domain-containing protein [Verrucomicrobiota bacterium]